MDGIKVSKTDHRVTIASRKNCEENKGEIQRKGGKRQGDLKRGEACVMRDELSACREARKNLPAVLTCQCCLSWWPAVWRKRSSMQEISKTESTRPKSKSVCVGKNYYHVIIFVQLICKHMHIYRDGNKHCYCCCWSSVILSAKSRKGDAGWPWEFSLEMRPWVCLNPPTVEQELEAKPKRPWITASESGGCVCAKVNPWSMQMSLGCSDSSWI